MIYPNTPIGEGISLPDSLIKQINQGMKDAGLYQYGLFKGIFSNLKEVSHGYITLEITYPEALPESERDRKYILMVMAYVLGSPVLDHVYHVLIIEYECLARPGYFEFDYYTQEERNKHVKVPFLQALKEERSETASSTAITSSTCSNK